MPEAVAEYIQTGKQLGAFQVQKDLIATFRQDFAKYAGKANKKCLDDVLISTAQNVGNQIKYAKLSQGFSIPTIKNAFNLLEDARIFKRVPLTNLIGIPLGAGAANNKFKAVFLDIGLMNQLCGLQTSVDYLVEDLMSIYKGALAEQFVGQELLSTGNTELFFWVRDAKNSSAEIDYLIAKSNNILPIEVKSGSTGRLKSLLLFLDSYPKIKESYVFSTKKYFITSEKQISYLPMYYAYNLSKNKINL